MISYYYSLNSPWTYLGHERLRAMAAKVGEGIRPYPVNFGPIFEATGGLPVPKRSKQRQDYRLAELMRWREYLDIELNLHPAHWPADDTIAANIVVNLRETDAEGALEFSVRVMRSVWAEEKNIADESHLQSLCEALGIDYAQMKNTDAAKVRDRDSKSAIAQGVFGAPTYIYRGELYWGQDRLDFLERALNGL
ncbi:MAG: 2-hydroxychromene-2-carboxylate isomerase [Pseudomonadota bacterium]